MSKTVSKINPNILNLYLLLLSNDKKITPPFGRLLLPSAAHPLCGSQTVFAPLKKYFRSPAMQGFFKKNGDQNNLAQMADLFFRPY